MARVVEAMTAKRAEVLARAAMLRSVPGSGYHNNDPLGPVKHPDPIGRRDADIDKHVIAFKTTFETWFVGDCGPRCHAAVKEYAEAHQGMMSDSRLDLDMRRFIEAAAEYAGRELSDGCFVVRNQQLNDVLAVLNQCDIGVTLTAV